MTPSLRPLHDLSDDELLQQLGRAAQALPEPPLALQRAALGLFTAPRAGSALGSALRQWAAVLSFDSWVAPASALGLRSIGSPTRHLLYSARGRDIDLRITPTADGFVLVGQVLGPDCSGSVELAGTGDSPQPVRAAALDDLGEFRISGLPRGVHLLTLRVGSDAIVLPPIDLADRPHGAA